MDGISANGTRYRDLAISGGAAEFEVELSAEGQSTAPQGYVFVSCSSSAVVTDLGVAARATIEPTFGIGPKDQPLMIENPFADDRLFWTAYMPDAFLGYTATGDISADLWGWWEWPTFTWSGQGSQHLIPPSLFNYTYHVSREYVLSMIDRGPDTKTFEVEVRDLSGVTRKSKITGQFFAPAHWLSVTRNERVFGRERRVSPFIRLAPGNQAQLDYDRSTMEAITKTITWTGGATLDISILERLGLLIDVSRSQEDGETAALTVRTNASFQLNNTSGQWRRYWLVGKPFWRRLTGFTHTFGPRGFEGLKSFDYTRWESGSKSEAELYDSVIEPFRRGGNARMNARMRLLQMLVLAALAPLGSSEQSRPQGGEIISRLPAVRMPSGTCDTFGWVPIDKYEELSGDTARALALVRAKDFAGAKRVLDRLIVTEPRNVVARKLRIDSVRGQGTLKQHILNLFAQVKKTYSPNQRFADRGLALEFTLALFLEDQDAQRVGKNGLLRSVGGDQPGTLYYSLETEEDEFDSVTYRIAFASVSFDTAFLAEKRRCLARFVSRYPHVYELRLLYARALSTSSGQAVNGAGMILKDRPPIPADEAGALRQAERVVKDAPLWAQGHFALGVRLVGIDRARAIASLRRGIQLSPPGSEQRQWATEMIERIESLKR